MSIPIQLRARCLILLLTLTLGLPACKFARGPAGFWKTYQAALISDADSDQGPWGGQRHIVWRSAKTGAFTFDEARRFATERGWKLLATSRYDGDSKSVPFVDAQDEHAPRFLPVPSTIGRFQSGWIREDPGTNETSTAYGYLQVSHDGAHMYVYHFWGNG